MIKLYGLLDRAKQNAHQDFAGHKLLNMLRVKQRNMKKKRKRENIKILKYKGNILLLALFESQHHSNTL